MLNRLKNLSLISSIDPRAIIKTLSSPKMVAVAKIFVASIALFQALESLTDAERKIGFKK